MNRIIELSIACIACFWLLGCQNKSAAPERIGAWDLAHKAGENQDKFKADYVGKRMRIDNLTTYAVSKTDTETSVDAFAYDPATETIYTSGDSKVAGKPVKGTEYDFFFKLIPANAGEVDTLKDSELTEVDGKHVREYSRPYAVMGTIKEMETDNTITLSDVSLLKE